MKSIEKTKVYQCSQCQFQIECLSDPSNYNRMQVPKKCANKMMKPYFNPFMKKQKMKQQMCGSKEFTQIASDLHDYQEIKLQDQFSHPGNLSRTINIILEGELVNQCKAGDDIIVGGIVIQRWKSSTKQPNINLCLLGRYLEIRKPIRELQQSQRSVKSLELRNQIVRSICPQICQRLEVKLGMLLCLIGGVSRVVKGSAIRGNSHVLLIGEAGTGKSTLLRGFSELSDRSIYVNGVCASQSGLTVSFVREGQEWSVDAGALVLSDQGLCCIDELNLIGKQELGSILEALEQQSISSSKAGISVRLNARTTLFAGCSPVGQRYDGQEDMEWNSGLSSPMMSRFDLIFVLRDEADIEGDRRSAQHILGQFSREEEGLISQGDIKEFVEHVRKVYSPVMEEGIQDQLSEYYGKLRMRDGRVTVRKLESLMRLCEAHARIMCRQQVEDLDVEVVIGLNENRQLLLL